jgi:hypothetical protein
MTQNRHGIPQKIEAHNQETAGKQHATPCQGMLQSDLLHFYQVFCMKLGFIQIGKENQFLAPQTSLYRSISRKITKTSHI